MLAVISPAKTLDFDTAPTTRTFSQPEFLAQSKVLIRHLRELEPTQIGKLMGISEKLSLLNHERYATWRAPFTPENAKQAVLAFRGDVYLGLQADQLSERDLAWAQDHLRILSGLHGLLRPLDLIQPYRLEMGTSLNTTYRNKQNNDLYGFWGPRLTKALNQALAQHSRPLLINLASKEYFSAVQAEKIDARIITPSFLDRKNGKYKFMSFYAKKARGLMAAYMIRERIKSAAKLQAFDSDGYYYCPERSTADEWVFLRDAPPA